MPIITELPAHYLADYRSGSAGNSQQQGHCHDRGT